MLKKLVLVLACCLFMSLVFYNTNVYAGQSKEKESASDVATEEQTDASTSWVHDAFSATKDFFLESDVEDKLGVVEPWMVVFSDIVRGVNRILLVLLAGLSIISLTIVGIKYLMSTNDAKRKGEAQEALHTTFYGMMYGFGAFAIWKIVMSIVKLIIYSF